MPEAWSPAYWGVLWVKDFTKPISSYMRLSPWLTWSPPCMPDSGNVSAVLIGKWLSAGFLAGLLPTDQGNQMPRRRPCLWICVKAVALEIQPGPGSQAVEELQEILACVEHKALALRKTYHTLDVALLHRNDGVLVDFLLIEYWKK